MKLNNTQLKSLANQLYTELSNAFVEKRKKEQDVLISKFEKSKDGKIISYLIDKYPQNFHKSIIISMSGATKIGLYPHNINTNIIYDDLVVASIESKDVKTLTEFIKNKYLKK